MTDDPNNKPLRAVGDEALEARIVAWVLGEASAFEASELEQLCAKDPEVALFVRRMRMLDGLIREKPAEPWKLPDEKRAKVIEVLGDEEEECVRLEVPPNRPKKRDRGRAVRRRLLAIAAVLVLLVVLGGLSAPMVLRQQKSLARMESAGVSYPAPGDEMIDLMELAEAEAGARGREALPKELIEGTPKPIRLPQAPSTPAPAREPSNLLTGGLRSGDQAVTRDSIDAILNRPEPTLEPAKPAAPSSSVSKAIASNTASPRAIPVPEEAKDAVTFFSEADEDFGTGWGGDGGGGGGSPQAGDVPMLGRLFDQREAGAPVSGEGSGSVTEIEGFVNYGSPILGDVTEEAAAMDPFAPADDSLLGLKKREAGRLDENGGFGRKNGSQFKAGSDDTDEFRFAERQSGSGDGSRADALDRPDRTNPAMAGGQVEKVEEVRRKLHLGESHHNLGEFDKAKEAYEQALRVDPYNSAARRGMEKIAAAKSDYYKAAYDSTRAELLAQVDAAWEEAVPVDSEGPHSAGQAMITNKLEQIHVPRISFEDTTLEEAIDFLRIRSIELDATELDPSRKGIGYAIRLPNRGVDGGLGSPGGPAGLRIESLELENASLAEALDRITRATGTEWFVDDHAVSILPAKEPQANHQETLDLMAEVAASEEPFSTFSLHVSDASFKLASAALQRGERPDPEGIRPEEFYNAFDYGDPAPSDGEPVACALEQAAHPAFPQRNLLRIAVRAGSSGRAQSVPLNLTLLLDNSGSMERADRAEGVARAVDQLSSLLKPGDKVTVAGFSRTPRLLADRLDGAQAAQLNEIVRQVPAEGGTNLEQALVLGEELATRQFVPGAQNRMVLFTDGAANLGDADPESLNTRVETMRRNGIAFDAAGFGADGLNDRLLERLTRNGNGRYYVVDDPAEADEGFANKLAGAFRPAAENVKVQVVFNPERVGSYKLIGFEEHRLKKEDFRDDTVDAAEMAAEEAGVALYQMEVLPEGRGEIGEVRVRFRDAAGGGMVERSWTIPYESDAPAFDQASESLQLATLAALAAEKLRDAPMAGVIDFRELAPVIGRVAAKYDGSERVAELRQMIEALR